ncbi:MULTISPECIES: hypothetical protein [Thermomonosporaceae]|uniref:hypothetical protein n=1 Tax=Thermomonosporaceae TaxID=2012 RepID=UPI00255AFFCB|nr:MULTISPECIES: hypothetical protein [Thermomonosporaceae]MDL4773614.1 hypothetical protein [Actinomadura xylanilytica]
MKRILIASITVAVATMITAVPASAAPSITAEQCIQGGGHVTGYFGTCVGGVYDGYLIDR